MAPKKGSKGKGEEEEEAHLKGKGKKPDKEVEAKKPPAKGRRGSDDEDDHKKAPAKPQPKKGSRQVDSDEEDDRGKKKGAKPPPKKSAGKKVESSSEESSDEAASRKKPAAKPVPKKGRGKKGTSDDSDDEPKKKAAPKPAPKKGKGKQAESSSESESESESSDDALKKKKTSAKPPPKKGKGRQEEESSSSEEESDEAPKKKAPAKPVPKKGKGKQEESSSEESDEAPKKKTPAKPAPKKGKGKQEKSSSSEEESDDGPKKKAPAKPVPKKGKGNQESSSSEEDESSSEDEAVKKPKPKAKAPAKAPSDTSSDSDSEEERSKPKAKPKPKAAAKSSAKDSDESDSDEEEDKKPAKKPAMSAPPKRSPRSEEDEEDEEEEDDEKSGSPSKPEEKDKWYNSDDEKKRKGTDMDMKGLTRKERKKLEKQIKMQEMFEAETAEKENSSPFTVQVPAEAITSMADNIRDVVINGVSVHVRGVELFRNVDVKFIAGRRYGLVGPNGKGKSTLLRLLDTREIPMPKNLHVLMVSQEQEVEAMDEPAVKVVIESDTRRLALLKEADELQKLDTAEALVRQREVEEELIAIDAFRADARARRILTGLGFPHEWHERPTRSFSGGWRKRIALACAVFMEPDFLMLDEPTNHLDLNAVIWLETYLPIMYRQEGRKKAKTLIVVSHDVSFLDNVCTDTVHIDHKKLMYYKGNYDAFCKGRKEQAAEHTKLYEKQQRQIMNWKKQGLSNKQIEEKMKTLAQRDGKTLDDVVLEKRREYLVNFPFPEPPELREAFIVRMTDCSFHYPNCEDLFQNLNLAIWTDSRITLCGPNGIGKSTLLNLMSGQLEPTAGTVERNHLVRIGRYSQHFVDSVPLDRTGVEYLQQLGLGDEFKCRQRLGNFGLESVRHLEKIGNLSGGQKARVAFAGISVSLPHLLLFDEPTNHLDMESIEALAEALNKFKGGVLLVTHDARLIKRTVNQIWVMGNKTVDTHSFSTFEDYKEHLVELMELEELRKEEEKEEREQERAQKAAQKAKAKEEERVRKEQAREKEKKEAKKGKKKKERVEEEEVEEEDEAAEKVEAEGKEEKKEEEVDEAEEPAVAKPEPKKDAKSKLNKLFSKKK